jgi:NTP pyrophosphatase (non-canonical NTP hydrolase)
MSLQTDIRAFAVARGWLKFHTPKNLAMAIASEAGELCHILRWEQPGEEFLFIPPGIAEEAADILIFTIRLMDELGVDYEQAIRAKMAQNAEKYPALGS